MLPAPRMVLTGGLSLVLVIAAAAASILPSARFARAACGDSTSDPEAVFAFDPPMTDYQITSKAPLAVTVTWLPGAVVPIGSTAFLDWGDGSAPTSFTGQDCGDGEFIEWPPQSHGHTYNASGNFTVRWVVNFVFADFNIPIAFVATQQATPPTATPTPTIPATPTVLASPTPAPSPAASTTPFPVAATAAATTAAQTQTPSTSPSPTRATGSTTAVPATPTPTSLAIAAASPPPPASTDPPEADIPAAISRMPRLQDISTDAATLATNITLAGVTIWVLFSSVLLNQVLQENRAVLDERTSRLTRPLRRFAGRSGGPGLARRFVGPALVLALTGIIYGLLDPGFGLNRSSAVLFLSVILGVGLVTYICSGIEALATRRAFGVAAAVRPFPASLAIACGSVAISRAIGLQPGVIYGFVASCAILGAHDIDERRQGAVTIFPVLAALVLSVSAWLIVEPLRADSSIASSFVGQVAIASGLIVFIGGIEGVAFNMIPLDITDGGKIFRWRRSVWIAISLVAAFLFWHVLLNRDRQFFDALRQADSLAVLGLFLAYTSLSASLWAYFRWHARPRPAAATP